MKKKNNNLAIGIFDSGIGGLTVSREIMNLLCEESVVYLGDTARVPYGTKSARTVRKYVESTSNFLLSKQIKLLVVACNTASAYAIESLKENLEIPVVGVVETRSEKSRGSYSKRENRHYRNASDYKKRFL